MSVGIVPSIGQVAILNAVLGRTGPITPPLTLFLWSNNVTPTSSFTNSSLTEVTGGGYASFALVNTDWLISSSDPSQALYNDFVDFNFTGAVGGSGNVYGYGIRDSNNILLGAERFDVTLTPVNGSLARIMPRLRLGNVTF